MTKEDQNGEMIGGKVKAKRPALLTLRVVVLCVFVGLGVFGFVGVSHLEKTQREKDANDCTGNGFGIFGLGLLTSRTDELFSAMTSREHECFLAACTPPHLSFKIMNAST